SARDPYAPSWLEMLVSSWCADGDGFCNGSWNSGNHGTIYRDYWYRQSAHEIADAAVKKRNFLNPDKPKTVLGAYTDSLSVTGPQAPAPQVLTLAQSVTVWPSYSTAVYQPLMFAYAVK